MRQIEVFTTGCPVCEPVVDLVRETACLHCALTVYDISTPCESEVCLDKVKEYGIQRLPAVVVDGQLLHCCQNNAITRKDLVRAGIGTPNG